MSDKEELHEHYAVSEIWCDGTADHYVAGGVLKFTYYSMQKIPGMQGVHRVAVLKIARSISTLEDSVTKIRNTLRSEAQSANGSGDPLILRPH